MPTPVLRAALWLVVALALALAPRQALAACPGACPVPGGGARASDCLVEFDGVVVAGRRPAVRCTDGDPTCDTDGAVNGSCRFRPAACFNNVDPRLPACRPTDVTSFVARRPRGDRQVAALEELVRQALPSTAARCTDAVPVYVPLRTRRGAYRRGTMRLITVARSASGRRDVDKLRFVCVPSAVFRRPGSAFARAKVITHAAELIEGSQSRGRLGDVLLANDRIQVVIQQPGRSMFGIGTYGGTIIDADRQRPAAEERDSFEELLPAINIENTANYTAVQVLNDGTNGEPAVVRATGPDDLLDFINASSVVAMAGFTFPAAADDRDLPVEVQTDYTLAPGASAVRIDTTVTNRGAAPLDLFLGDYMNGSGQVELFQPVQGFGEPLVTLRCPPASYQPCARGTCDACNFVAYSGEDGAAGVSYGYVHGVDGSSSFSVSGVTAVLLGNEVLAVLVGAAEPNFHLATAGAAGDALTVTRHFVVGDGSVAAITDVRNALAGATVGTLAGRVTSAGQPLAAADVAILGPPVAGGPTANVVDHVRTDTDGRYRLTLAPGAYTVRANKDGRVFGTPDPASVTITADATTTQDFTLPAAGRLRVTVTDEQGAPVPAKVQLIGFDPSPDPLNSQSIFGIINNVNGVFGDQSQDGLPFGIAHVFFADRTGDIGMQEVEPGTYHLAVSRGSRYSLFSQRVTVTEGSLTTVQARIARVIDTPEFITTDFHVHAIDSPDSEVTRVERVATQLAEGIDFFTPSEHDIRVDFAPTVAAMGVGHLIATAPSAEITTFDYGHFNSWPVTVDATQVNGGTVDWGRTGVAPGADFPALGSFGLTPAEIFAVAKADPKGNLVQINHIDSFFNATGLDIDTAEAGTGPPQSHIAASARRLNPAVSNYFDAGFDALEVWNGSVRIFLGENIGDWFNLLNQGIRRTAVANSDTHERRTNGGSVRTYLASTVTAPGELAAIAEDLAANVVAGRAVGTNGPFVSIGAFAPSTGERATLTVGATTTLATTDGAVDVTVTVKSPRWAEFDRVELYVNNAPQPHDHDANPMTRLRYRVLPDFVQSAGTDFTVVSVDDRPDIPGAGHLEATVTVPLVGLTVDSWIVALVRGTVGVSRPLFPVYPFGISRQTNGTPDDLVDGNLGEGGEVALAFTNPLYVDVGNDGTWTAPGVRLTAP